VFLPLVWRLTGARKSITTPTTGTKLCNCEDDNIPSNLGNVDPVECAIGVPDEHVIGYLSIGFSSTLIFGA
jgi:hypothetical protein